MTYPGFATKRNSTPPLKACNPRVMLKVSAYEYNGESLPRAVPAPIILFANSEGRGMNGMPLFFGRTYAPLGLSGSQPMYARRTELR